ncbi:MAG: hypothetical protein NTX01_06660 [Candidatus Omnitrophica bacterium]|nr:hypothetical protein [Candidatus Omnitrophota bacterium]
MKKIDKDRKPKLAKTEEISAVNGRVWFLMTDGGLCKAGEEIRPKLRGQQLSFPFLFTSFSGLNKNTYYNKAYTDYTKDYSDNRGKLFEEITCQADGKNGFTQITDKFSDKFSARFINDYHRFNVNTAQGFCQEISKASCNGSVNGENKQMCHCEERSDEAILTRLLRSLRSLAMTSPGFNVGDD